MCWFFTHISSLVKVSLCLIERPYFTVEFREFIACATWMSSCIWYKLFSAFWQLGSSCHGFFHRTEDSNLGGNQFIEVVLLWVMFWFHVEEYPALVLKYWHVFLIDYNFWEQILPSTYMLSVPQRARWTTRDSTRFTGKSHQVLGLPSSAAQTSPISSEI